MSNFTVRSWTSQTRLKSAQLKPWASFTESSRTPQTRLKSAQSKSWATLQWGHERHKHDWNLHSQSHELLYGDITNITNTAEICTVKAMSNFVVRSRTPQTWRKSAHGIKSVSNITVNRYTGHKQRHWNRLLSHKFEWRKRFSQLIIYISCGYLPLRRISFFLFSFKKQQHFSWLFNFLITSFSAMNGLQLTVPGEEK